MSFSTDKQTLDDLNIFGQGAVYGLFNHTQTHGGALLMERMFREPLSRPEAIRKRVEIFKWFAGGGLVFPCKPEWFDAIEQYLANTDERTKLSRDGGGLGVRLAGLITSGTEQAVIHKGVGAMVEMVHACAGFVSSMAADGSATAGSATAGSATAGRATGGKA